MHSIEENHEEAGEGDGDPDLFGLPEFVTSHLMF